MRAAGSPIRAPRAGDVAGGETAIYIRDDDPESSATERTDKAGFGARVRLTT